MITEERLAREMLEKWYNEFIQEAINKGAIIVTDKEQANQIFSELDQQGIKTIKARISGAHKLADEICDIAESGEHLNRDHISKAYQYISRLKTIADPRKKILLHYDQATSEYLSKLLEQTLNIAIDRIKSAIDVIENKIEISKKANHKKEFIDTLEKACYSLIHYESLKNWFKDQKYTDPDLNYDYNKFPLFVLASYLKNLHRKKYTRKLRHIEIKFIAKNSFNAEMGIDTVKQAKTDTSDLPDFVNSK